jgi:hypothetical protein
MLIKHAAALITKLKLFRQWIEYIDENFPQKKLFSHSPSRSDPKIGQIASGLYPTTTSRQCPRPSLIPKNLAVHFAHPFRERDGGDHGAVLKAGSNVLAMDNRRRAIGLGTPDRLKGFVLLNIDLALVGILAGQRGHKTRLPVRASASASTASQPGSPSSNMRKISSKFDSIQGF